MQIRDYQEELVSAAFRDWSAGARSTLAVMPTGAGKTVAFAEVARRWLQKGPGRVLVVAHRDKLLQQARDKLWGVSDYVGIEAGSQRLDRNAIGCLPVVVASKDSLHDGRIGKFQPEDFGLLIVDEAHRAAQKNETYGRLYRHFAANPNHKVLGVTATCGRSDKVGLVGPSCAFDTLCYQYPLWKECGPCALTDGWLVPPRQLFVVCEGIDVDLSRCQVRSGADFTAAQIEEVFAAEKHLHQTALGIIEHAGARPTFVFCSTIAHCSGYEKDGVHVPGLCDVLNTYRKDSALPVHGKRSAEANDAAMRAFRRGDIQFLVSCDKLIEGVDETRVACVAVCRPTKFWGRYCQMVGRSLRPLDCVVPALNAAPDAASRRRIIAESPKADALVLDFVGLHGLSLAVSLADVLAEAEEDTPVLRLAKAKAAQKGGPADMVEAMAEAKAEVWQQETKQFLARRAELLARATFSAQEVDPFGGGSSHNFQGPKPMKQPATEKQVRYLCYLGVSESAARGYSKGQAGAVIDRLTKQRAG